MANTTAKQRELAKLYEDRCEWLKAAQCWEEALRLYPSGTGQLREMDKKRLEQNAKNCRYAAAQS